MTLIPALICVYVAAGLAYAVSLVRGEQGEKYKKLLAKLMRLVPGYREDLVRNSDDPVNQVKGVLLITLGWPLAMYLLHQASKHVEELEYIEDAQIALRRLSPAEQATMRAPFTYRGINIEVDKITDANELTRFLANVGNVFFGACGMAQVVALPSKERPLAVLYRGTVDPGLVDDRGGVLTAGVRVGRVFSASTFEPIEGESLVLRVELIEAGAVVAVVEEAVAACMHCYINRNVEIADGASPKARGILMALAAILTAHNAACPRSNDSKLDVRGAARGDAEGLGGALRQVDDAAGDERPTVVDADRDRGTGVDVGHKDVRVEGQGLVGGGEPGRVEGLAVGREVPLESGPVPARDTGLVGGPVATGGRASGPEQRAPADDGAQSKDPAPAAHPPKVAR